MTPSEYLRGIKRRWVVIAAALVIALAVGFLSVSVIGKSPVRATGGPSQASAIILDLSSSSSSTTGQLFSLDTLAAVTTIGKVPERAAEELGTDEDPLKLAQRIEATADTKTSLLTITATSPKPKEAPELANTFARELIDYVRVEEKKAANREKEQAEASIASLEEELAELEKQEASASEAEAEDLRRQQDSLQGQIDTQKSQASQASGQSAGAGGKLQIIQEAVPAESLSAVPIFEGPKGVLPRMLIAAIVGLAAGIALALVMERFDNKIRSKEGAERNYRLPVLAEIPLGSKRRPEIVVVDSPRSVSADAYRMLAVGLKSARADSAGPTPPKMILVTSAERSEGKTTVVANLAASFSELGKKVLVIGCDFRHPTLHRLFGFDASPGLSEALRSSNGTAVLNGHVKTAEAKGLSLFVLPSGEVPDRPAELLSSANMRRALAEARDSVDVILLDTPSILSASDASLLLPEVDTVIVVARAGKTSEDHAQRSSEMLQRLGAPLSGVVLNAVTETSLSGYSWFQRRRGIPGLARHSKAK